MRVYPRVPAFWSVLGLILLLACLSLRQADAGNTYYVNSAVAPGNSCTAARNRTTPVATITTGLSCMTAGAGDTVVVLAGTYAEGLNNLIPAGTSTNPSTLKSETPLAAMIKAPALGSPQPMIAIFNSWVVVDGFILDATNNENVVIGVYDGQGTVVQNNEIRNMLCTVFGCADGGGGVKTADPATNITFRNNHIHHIAWGINDNKTHCMYISAGNTLFEGNELDHCEAFGVHQYHTGVALDNNVYRNNVIHDLTTKSGMLLSSGSNTQAYNNIIYNAAAEGIHVGDYGAGCCTNVQVYNNTIWHNGLINGACIGVGTDAGQATATIVRNNICYQNNVDAVGDSGTGTVKSNNLFANPTFVNPGPPTQFHIQSGSGAKDQGFTVGVVTTDIDGESRPQPPGGAYDIGADEYAVSLPPGPCTTMILRLPFEEGTGTTAGDTSGAGNNATLVGGVTWTGGRIGHKATTYNGTTQYGQVTGLLGNPATLTLSLWYNLASLPPARMELLSLGDNVVLYLSGTRLDGFYYGVDSLYHETILASPPPLGWHHLAYVANPSGSVQKLYLDGQPRVTSAATAAVSYAWGPQTILANHGNGGTSFLAGALDDVRVYNCALADADVQALYYAASPIRRHFSGLRQ